MPGSLSRRELLKQISYASSGVMLPSLLSLSTLIQSSAHPMIKRLIPASGEALPVVGLGSWLQFDVGSSKAEREPLSQVLQRMAELGGKLIDSSPMYGQAEQVIGDLTTQLGQTDKFFLATKVWTSGQQAGIEQMQASLKKMGRKTMDLMQVHNLVDWQTHLNTINAWKQEGKVRYSGVTHYTTSAHGQLEQIARSKAVDFVQFNYSIRVRSAERSLLATAADSGVAVIINEPYERGSLFQAVKGKQLPEWATEYQINSWGQFFLKYILSHPAVTCVIPGTSDVKHLEDNLKAGQGRLPDEQTRRKMVEFMQKL
jgi:aryl-alcohol dehydrogenase-like predicted oxidoreductase